MRSAPTARASSPAVGTRRRRCGTRETGTSCSTLKGHTGRVISVRSAPTARGSSPAVMTRRRRSGTRTTGAEPAHLKGHTEPCHQRAFSPDGTRIVTGSDDQTAKVWDATTGGRSSTLKGHTGRRSRRAFSPDGTRIVTGSADKTAKVWTPPAMNLVRTALDAEELAYRLIHTRPNYRASPKATTLRAGQRPLRGPVLPRPPPVAPRAPHHGQRFQERNTLQADPLLIARTGFHHPALAKTPYDRGTVATAGRQRRPPGPAPCGPEILREGKPGPAIPLLFGCLCRARPPARRSRSCCWRKPIST